MATKRAVVIIPTYIERENIQRLLPVLMDVFQRVPKHWEMHILVVDDSSPDKTGEAVKEFARTHKNVHLLTNEVKNGLGAAYLSGMKEAFGPLKADVVFQFDADFSHDPQKIPEFLEKIDAGYDFVLGSRYIKGGSIPSNWGISRKFLSVFGNLFINLVMTTFVIRDWTAGFRAITKKVYDAVVGEMVGDRFSGYTFQVGFVHKALMKGFKITEIPIHFVDRIMGRSKLGAEYMKNTLMYILKVRAQEILAMRIFKFAVVGVVGFTINTIGLFLFSRLALIATLAQVMQKATGFTFINESALAAALGAECAIVSNFILNNIWTFKDRKLQSPLQIVSKFLQFNLASFGAVVIQFVVVGIGTSITGQGLVSRLGWLVFATAFGMVLNYFIYSKVIWKSKK